MNEERDELDRTIDAWCEARAGERRERAAVAARVMEKIADEPDADQGSHWPSWLARAALIGVAAAGGIGRVLWGLGGGVMGAE